MLHPSQGNARWNWDRETLVKTQGLLSTLTTFQHIISFIIDKNTLHTVKGIAAKLQKNGHDRYEAYQMINNVRSILKEMRTNIDKEFQDSFKEAKQIANEVGVDIKVPCYAHHQQTRANAPADTPLQYFKLNVGIPFLDHINQEMSSRFCEENRPGPDLFLLVPSVVCKWRDLHSMNNKLQFWKDNIPIHLSLLNEIKEWKCHWTLQQPQEGPTTLFECYLAADEDHFPNIKALLRNGCTLPVGTECRCRAFLFLSVATKDLFKEQNG